MVIVDESWVFRFAKTDWGRQALNHEAQILDLVRRHVSLPVPAFEFQDTGFVLYRLLPGEALHRETILRQDEATQDRLAEQIAGFLQAMHAIPHDDLEAAQIPVSDAARTRETWISFYHDLERDVFPLLMSHAREWVIDHFAPLLNGSLDLTYDPVLIHGDLGPYHILYEARQISGVIDFGTAGLGDPADDFANIIHGLGESFLHRMITHYSAITSFLDRARFHAGTLELQWALHGVRSGDLTWLVSHIGRARDMWPIGL